MGETLAQAWHWLLEQLNFGLAWLVGAGVAFTLWIKAGGWAAVLRWWRQYRADRMAASMSRREEELNRREQQQADVYQRLLNSAIEEMERRDQRHRGELAEVREDLAAVRLLHLNCQAEVQGLQETIEELQREARERDARIEYIERACPNCPARRDGSE